MVRPDLKVTTMPPRANPLKLNRLQLKTLAVLQELARHEEFAETADDNGSVLVNRLPPPHGDHLHIGQAVVATSDTTGLRNRAVFGALARKGLVEPWMPDGVAVTSDGLAYDTGLADSIVHRSNH